MGVVGDLGDELLLFFLYINCELLVCERWQSEGARSPRDQCSHSKKHIQYRLRVVPTADLCLDPKGPGLE